MAEKKVWLITGCDSGMGKAIAETVLEHGDKVIVTARDAANVAALCEQFPTTAFPFELDVTKPDDIRHVVAQGVKLNAKGPRVGRGAVGRVGSGVAGCFFGRMATGQFKTCGRECQAVTQLGGRFQEFSTGLVHVE